MDQPSQPDPRSTRPTGDGSPSGPGLGPYVLRRGDQRLLAVVTLVALATVGLWWARQGGLQGRVIELDRATPLKAKYLVDVNRADWPELIQLPGVGETLAMRIIESRRRDGPFLDHDDLRRVHGIGPKTLDALRPYLLPLAPDEAVADTHAPLPPGG